MDFENAIAVVLVLSHERSGPYYEHTKTKQKLFDEAWARLDERVSYLISSEDSTYDD